jgi:hypothetical protein
VICEEHSLTMPCALCERGAWPLRDLRALADFAGKPVDGPGGVPPELPSQRLSVAIRRLGRRWAEIERAKATVLRPLYATKNDMVREARKGPIDVGRLERAVGLAVRGETRSDDPVVNAYLQAIIEDDVAW